MPYFRRPKDHDHPYAQVSNDMLEDSELSFKAKGLLSYLLSRSDEWEVYQSQLADLGPDGEDAVRSGLQELMDAGYLKREARRNGDGTFSEWEYIIHESPVDGAESNTGFSNTGSSNTGSSNTGKSHPTNTKKQQDGKNQDGCKEGADESAPPSGGPLEEVEEEWHLQAALYLLDGLRERDVLHSGIDTSQTDREIAAKWADTFRLLSEQDEYSKTVIRGTLWWLLNTDNWWIKNVIQSGSNGALRSRGDDGAHKFDKLVQRARRYYEQKQSQQADPSAIRDGFATDERDAKPAGSSGDSLPDEQRVDIGGFSW